MTEIQDQNQTNPNEVTKPTFPNSLTTVNKLSKTIALILFIALPFIGFMLGMRYQSKYCSPVINDSEETINARNLELSKALSPPTTLTPTPKYIDSIITDDLNEDNLLQRYKNGERESLIWYDWKSSGGREDDYANRYKVSQEQVVYRNNPRFFRVGLEIRL